MLENVLLDVVDKYLTIKATDGIILAYLRIESEIEKPLKVLIPFHKLSEFVNAWSNDLILTKSKSKLIIKSGKDELKIPLQQEVEEFEQRFEVLTLPKRVINVSALPWKVAVTSQVANPEFTRMPAIQGVHIAVDKEGIVTVEAADGLRFLWIKEKLDKKVPDTFDCIVNQRAGELMSTLSEPGQIWRDDRYFYYKNEAGLFAVLLVAEPSFPVLSHLVPKNKRADLTLKKSELDLLLKKVNVVGAERVSLSNNNGLLHAEAFNEDYDCISDIPAEIKGKMPPIIVQTNHLTYISGLHKTKDITFHLESSSAPLWYGDYWVCYLSMPYASV